ncbi:uncharacterized protein LOC143888491 [Tasmannia lanceolata]|uniref:uncharacterized protein LOC143888491 n=1 Tax=Tasmannia lanceolata TaxID=3420 RepID=UPI004063AD77
MVKDVCTKIYPKSYKNLTTIDENGFLLYRRRKDGQKPIVQGRKISNRWVVPYNLHLLIKYNAHINVELCAKTQAIKYLYKFIHKGPDRATAVLETESTTTVSQINAIQHENDEIKQYLDCRYISALEACWRIFEFDLQGQQPPVERLNNHLPGEQSIIFNDNDDLQNVMSRPGIERTMFTEWMEANNKFDDACMLRYVEFPTSWVWDRTEKEWHRQKRGRTIGRIFYVHPSSGERYYLRMLLNIVRRPMSYEDIRTVDKVIYPDFKSACNSLGRLEDDNEWHQVLQEVSVWASGRQLRHLFASILTSCEVIDPLSLWETHWRDLSDDLQVLSRRNLHKPNLIISKNDLRDIGLYEIECILNNVDRSLSNYPPMPLPTGRNSCGIKNRLIWEERNYDQVEAHLEFERLHCGLTHEQLLVFDTVMDSCTNKKGDSILLRSDGMLVLRVPSSGIASLLLPGGRTAHSRFKISLKLDNTSTCFIKPNTKLSELMEEVDLIIWDEAPMVHRQSLEAVDRTFKDLLKISSPSAAQKVSVGKLSSLVVTSDKFYLLYQNQAEKLLLALPYRDHIYGNIARSSFAQWLLDIGNGTLPAISVNGNGESNWVKIPEDMLISDNEFGIRNLISEIYLDGYLESRVILAPKNNDVDYINSIMIEKLSGEGRSYLSADTVADDNVYLSSLGTYVTPEYLNSLNVSEIASHCLKLKVGALVVLLRNLDPTIGLCNGTRLTIVALEHRTIRARIITGENKGVDHCIPRMSMSPSSDDFPLKFQRRQFPLKVSFAMTINKSQGQTLTNVGIYLLELVFSHYLSFMFLPKIVVILTILYYHTFFKILLEYALDC